MHPHLRTRIVLASGARARWLERDGARMVTLAELTAAKHKPSHHTAAVHQSAGHGAHTAGLEDVAERSRADFGAEIADIINDQAAQDDFQRLAIVAPPRLLKAIHDGLTPRARTRVVQELAKDLTKVPVHELESWLGSPGFG